MSQIEVEITNFKCLGQYSAVINDGFTRLCGLSEVGKTTFMDAIEWCLYKPASKNKGIAPLFKVNAETRVKVNIVVDELIAIRYTKPNRFEVIYQGNTYQQDDAQGIINYLYGSYKVWKAACYIDQHSITSFIQELTPNEKSSLLEELFLAYDTGPIELAMKTEKIAINNSINELEVSSNKLLTILNSHSNYKESFEINYKELKAKLKKIQSEYDIYKQKKNDYNKYVQTYEALTAWLSSHSDIESKLSSIEKYEKWKKAETLIKSIASYPEYSIEEIDDIISRSSNNETVRLQLSKLKLLDDISAIPVVDTEIIRTEIAKINKQISQQKQYIKYTTILGKYGVSSVKDLSTLSEELEKLNTCVNYAKGEANIEKYLSMPNGIEQQISLYNDWKKYEGIDIEQQKIALLQSTYKDCFQQAVKYKSFWDEADKLLKEYTPEQLRMASKKLTCPHCEGKVFLTGSELTVAVDLDVSEGVIKLLNYIPKGLTFNELGKLFATSYKLVLSESEIKSYDISKKVDKPEYTIQEVDIAKKIKSCNPDIKYLPKLKLWKELIKDIQDMNNITNTDFIADIDELNDLLASKKHELEIAIANDSKRHAYHDQLPDIEITYSKEELESMLVQTNLTLPQLYELKRLKLALSELGEISFMVDPKFKKNELLILLREKQAKEYALNNLETIPDPGPDIYTDEINTLKAKCKLEEVYKICYPAYKEREKIQKQITHFRNSLEKINNIKYKLETTKKEKVQSHIASLNSILESRSAQMSKYLDHNIRITIDTVTENKGKINMNPKISIYYDGVEIKPINLCGVETRIVAFVICLCLSSFSFFPIIMADEVFAFTDDEKIGDIIECIRRMICGEEESGIKVKSILMTIHRFDEDAFTNYLNV